MIAFSIFAMVAVGAMTIMNRSMAIAQRSLEVTQVRAQMDTQAELLRYIHGRYTTNYPASDASWAAIKDKVKAPAGLTPFGQCAASAANSQFFITESGLVSANIQASAPTGGTLPPYAQVRGTQAYGLWIEAVRGGSVNPRYIDFHIRACWDGAGSTTPVTLGTIVRLYEP